MDRFIDTDIDRFIDTDGLTGTEDSFTNNIYIERQTDWHTTTYRKTNKDININPDLKTKPDATGFITERRKYV